MLKPVLVVMAAGMGSRYGGLKQLDPIDDNGHVILDYSVYDARRAGFETVVFVIKPEIEEDFRALMSYVRKHSFSAFGWYRIVLGAVVLVYFVMKAIID